MLVPSFLELADRPPKPRPVGLTRVLDKEEVTGDRAVGARWVIAEGRESGSVGIYRPDRSIRTDSVTVIIRTAGADAVLFEHQIANEAEDSP